MHHIAWEGLYFLTMNNLLVCPEVIFEMCWPGKLSVASFHITLQHFVAFVSLLVIPVVAVGLKCPATLFTLVNTLS